PAAEIPASRALRFVRRAHWRQRMAITPPRCRQRKRRAVPSTAVDRSKPRRYGPRAMVATSRLLGRSQVVRQRILIPPFPGSSPGAPANQGIEEEALLGGTARPTFVIPKFFPRFIPKFCSLGVRQAR